MINIQKCAIIGCGLVGSTIAFTLAENGMFSELVLIDINHKKALGEAMDINHGIPFAMPAKVYAGDYDDIKNCSLVIVSAGANQKPGETRMDLINKNVNIFKKIIPEIIKRNDECILLVVSNPVDILTYVTLKISGLPANRVIGSGTVLDTSRLKYLLGQYLNVDARYIHAYIIGEHGDSELAIWSSANISGVGLEEFFKLRGYSNGKEIFEQVYQEVKHSAYKIIESKGATYYAIAMATERIAECIVRNEHSIMPVSALLNNHYGISDVCMGLPSIVSRKGIEVTLEAPLSNEEKNKLYESANILKTVLKQLKL